MITPTSKTSLRHLGTGLITALLVLLLFSGCGVRSSQHSAADSGMDLYLLIGQSNMAGRAEIGPAERDSLKNVYLFTGTGWEPAANPLNRYSTVRKALKMQKLGPGYGFARKLEACTGRKIGLIVNARGGTSIAWWAKGYTGPNDFDLYEQAVAQAKKALRSGHLKGIIWHQGENDQRHPATYMAQLKILVENLRRDLGVRAFFVAGEIGAWRQSSAAMNRVLGTVPQQIPDAACATTEGLTPLKGDTTNPHFDTRSQIVLGERYADQVLKNVYRMKPCKP